MLQRSFGRVAAARGCRAIAIRRRFGRFFRRLKPSSRSSRYVSLILTTDYEALVVAGALLALSAMIDQLVGGVRGHDLAEDGFKLLGIVTWFVFQSREPAMVSGRRRDEHECLVRIAADRGLFSPPKRLSLPRVPRAIETTLPVM